MYPNFFSALGGIAEGLFITKELKFYFKLLENILKERLQSKEVSG
jgi:cytochrome P450 family 3 subfamily A